MNRSLMTYAFITLLCAHVIRVFAGSRVYVRGDSELLACLCFALAIAPANCLYAPEVKLQSSEIITDKYYTEQKL
jgi:hypothetical protein